jgi:hypothetical protein
MIPWRFFMVIYWDFSMVMWKIQRHGNDDLPWGEHRKKNVGNPWFPGNAEEVIPLSGQRLDAENLWCH